MSEASRWNRVGGGYRGSPRKKFDAHARNQAEFKMVEAIEPAPVSPLLAVLTPDQDLDRLIAAGWGDTAQDRLPEAVKQALKTGAPLPRKVDRRRKAGW